MAGKTLLPRQFWFSGALLAFVLMACNMSLSLTPPPAEPPVANPPQAVQVTPPPTLTPPPTAMPEPAAVAAPTVTPLPVEMIARLVLDELQQQGLLENEAAFIDAVGRDLAERRIIEVYDRVSPSVVNITTQVLRRSFFFEVVPAAGAGSGFVLDSAGHIVTNYHVIRDARQIEVTFIDETTLPAKLVGGDPRNDIAVIKVDAPAELLTPVELGDSAGLRVGQRTIVIGNPFGQFGGTLTTGVISALNRSIEGPDTRQISGIIQTDAAINSGNSGGPLLDSAGQVIGINSAIFSPSGTSAGVGFAIPVNTMKRVLPDLLELGRYRHPWLGVRYAYRITPAMAEVLELPVEQGLLLVELYNNGPLALNKAQGAQQEAIVGNQRIFIGGDILTALDGEKVTSLEELQLLLETKYQVGDPVTVTLLRDGKEFTISVKLAEEITS